MCVGLERRLLARTGVRVITSGSVFRHVLSRGRRIERPSLLLCYDRYPYSHIGGNVGYVVSRKAGCSVVRNRIKRYMRSGIRDALSFYSAATGLYYVLVSRKTTRLYSFFDVRNDIIIAVRTANDF